MTFLQTALLRLASRPLAIAPRALETLLAASRVALAPHSDAVTRGGGYAVTDSGIAVVPALGPLVARGDWLTELFGASIYGEVGEAVEAALADPSVRGVVMEIDSPGGEVAGMFDLADRLGALRTASSKPLWAVASESATSAAYAIASTAERITTNEAYRHRALKTKAQELHAKTAPPGAGAHLWQEVTRLGADSDPRRRARCLAARGDAGYRGGSCHTHLAAAGWRREARPVAALGRAGIRDAA